MHFKNYQKIPSLALSLSYLAYYPISISRRPTPRIQSMQENVSKPSYDVSFFVLLKWIDKVCKNLFSKGIEWPGFDLIFFTNILSTILQNSSLLTPFRTRNYYPCLCLTLNCGLNIRTRFHDPIIAPQDITVRRVSKIVPFIYICTDLSQLFV